jgi:hypothetical protein
MNVRDGNGLRTITRERPFGALRERHTLRFRPRTSQRVARDTLRTRTITDASKRARYLASKGWRTGTRTAPYAQRAANVRAGTGERIMAGTRKTTAKVDATLAAALNASNVATFARTIGKPERATRIALRTQFGVYVGKNGDPWDDRTKRALYAYLTTDDKGTRKGIVDAFKGTAAK